jgi:hypothetical protein
MLVLSQITQSAAALWTNSKFTYQADQELDCDWKIFAAKEEPTIADWLEVEFSKLR